MKPCPSAATDGAIRYTQEAMNETEQAQAITDPQLPSEPVRREWLVVTEHVRRAITENRSDVRDAAYTFISAPVSQTMPADFLDAVTAADSRLAAVTGRHAALTQFTHTPAIPEDQVGPNLRVNVFGTAVTAEERKQVAEKYVLARDVKLFALAAELRRTGDIGPAADGVYTLPSGTRIGIAEQSDTPASDLLSPHLWERRRQIKDRVYGIRVNGRDYILKERKTNRHTDTRNEGHIPTLEPHDEFAVAAQFCREGTVETDGIIIDWEYPEGFVEFPDGYGFTVYRNETGTIDARTMETALAGLLKQQQPSRSDDEIREEVRQRYTRMNSLRTWIILAMGYDDIDNQDRFYRLHTDIPGGTVEHIGYDFEYFLRLPPPRHRELVAWTRKHRPDLAMHEEIFPARLDSRTWKDLLRRK